MKLIPLVFALLAPTSSLGGQDTVPTFDRVQADSTFRSEGGTAFDVDGDGAHDLVVGPYWYAGPDFAERYAIWEPTDFDPVGYSDSFFGWPFDGNSDGHTDLFAVGFPGQAAYWFVNPGGRPDGESVAHWTRHEVLAAVDNESPNFIDLVGDAAPELVCQTGGAIGYATPNPGDPTAAWIFHNISPNLELQRFTHGLGTGDVDGDGRRDILWRDGWWRQPESLEGDPVWEEVKVPFSKRGGGAQMFVLDVDDDGDSDVITSLQAHGFGLSWFEQDGSGTSSTWTEHVITDDQPEDSSYGIRFGEIHALDMADMDGDGLLDIVTGKRWWSHGASGDPEPGAPAVAYAFLLRRGEDGVDWLPCLIDDDSGVGVQVQAIDVNQDGRMDVVVGNKKGAFVLYQSEERVPAMAKVQADQSKAQGGDGGVDGDDSFEPQDALGNSLNLDFETGDLTGWHFEGNAFEGQPVLGDTVAARGRGQARHQGKYWMGGYELDGDEPQGTMVSSAFRVRQPWGSFLVGGGYTDMTRIEIVRVADDHVIYKTSGTAYEDMQRVVVDLRQEVGQDVVVRIVDMSSGGWGHINFDDMRLHQERPSFDLPDGLPPILPKDKIQHAGLAPQDAAAAMTVPDGFQVELIASEPDLHQPVAMTIDGRGRIWVAEAHSYPQKRAEGEGLDLIKVLEDRDNNGSFETITVFMDGLNLVSGLEVGHGGVWVGQAPEFMFIPDANDDLIPDGPPEVLLDGWDIRDTHETLNAFNWGPDGWLYGCHGVFSHARVGKPGTPDADRTPMNAGVWRYHPTRHEFEVFAWGSSNPWGVDWNDDGQAFISACVIPHLFHVIQGGRYERQGGTHFQPWVYDDIKTIADHRHYLGATPHGGNLRSNVVGGGHAHCGALLYSGNQFPEEYRNAVFMNNIHGNRVNVDYPVRSGSGFVGEHGDDLLLSNDAWHRGIAFRTGADGSVYLIDWYDKQACHVNDAAIWNRTNGRMYRISYGDSTPIALNIPALSSDELLELLPNRNDFLSRRARIELQERGPDAAIAAKLISAIRSTDERHPRLRFLWALHAIEGLDEGFGLELLADGDEMVTAWTIQLLSEHGTPSAQVLAKFAQLAGDNASPVVRLYLASALQRLDHDARWETLAALSQKGDDAADQNIPY
ncbi:MAG: putative membrane-bound dehydrogenase-like protein, partial [Gammaproteobacteria bacterium]